MPLIVTVNIIVECSADRLQYVVYWERKTDLKVYLSPDDTRWYLQTTKLKVLARNLL